MTRLGSIVVMFLALSSPAWAAAGVTVADSTGPASKVGREGAWRMADADATIGEKDFLAIPAGATVRVTLPDGQVASFTGKIVVPGRRLVSDKSSASNVAWLARAIQSASDAVGGVAVKQEGPGAAKVETVGSRPDQGMTASRVTSADDVAPPPSPKAPKQDEAKKVEKETEKQPARDVDSLLGLSETDASPTKARPAARAQAQTRAETLRDGLTAESDGNFETARTLLVIASKKPKKGGTDVRAIRAEAYVALGRVHLQLGLPNEAAVAFDQAIRLDTAKGATGPHAARAHFLLGMSALERGDVKAARRKFALLKEYPALDAAAKQALTERPH